MSSALNNEPFRRTLEGVVTSVKMQKTAIVETVRKVFTRKTEYWVKKRKKYAVHDEDEVLNVGDRVRIVHSRRHSKNKHFELKEIITPATPYHTIEVMQKKANKYPIKGRKHQRNLLKDYRHGYSNPEIRAFIRTKTRQQNWHLAQARVRTHGFDGYDAVFRAWKAPELFIDKKQPDGTVETVPLPSQKAFVPLIKVTKGAKMKFHTDATENGYDMSLDLVGSSHNLVKFAPPLSPLYS